MTIAHFRFAIFASIVLGVPAVLMAAPNAGLVDLGKLTMILSPAIAGLALSPWRRERRSKVRWVWIACAGALTLVIALASLAVAMLAGAADFHVRQNNFSAILVPMSASALTSILEELGWANGGLAMATTAFGRRLGVMILGLVWAAWHLVPVVMRTGLFPYLETAPPLMIAAFIVSCLLYRELLTRLRERSGSWLGAAAGHAVPNMLLAGMIAAGVVLSGRQQDWPLFPAPGGLFFPAFVLLAMLALRRFRHETTETV
ncbi:MAG: CPBP family glutamic-type intramembrane protease [Hyphomonadaceae bacterium]